MINSVRQTVLSVLNKNNYGYITPADFNLYAHQAQLELFDELMSGYNKQVTRENLRRSGTGLADEKQTIAETIERFITIKPLGKTSAGTSSPLNSFYLPSQLTTGDEAYLLNRVMVYRTQLASGDNTSIVTSSLFDSTVNFVNAGVAVGDLVVNYTTEEFAYVTSVTANVLGLTADIFQAGGQLYRVLDASAVKIADRVELHNIQMLKNSMLTAPSLTFPAYVTTDVFLQAYPESITNYGQVVAQYLRYPLTPKWTYQSLTNGEPVFDSGQSDYQDFELTEEFEYMLVYKILQYSGLSIREIPITQYAQAQEQVNELMKQPQE